MSYGGNRFLQEEAREDVLARKGFDFLNSCNRLWQGFSRSLHYFNIFIRGSRRDSAMLPLPVV